MNYLLMFKTNQQIEIILKTIFYGILYQCKKITQHEPCSHTKKYGAMYLKTLQMTLKYWFIFITSLFKSCKQLWPCPLYQRKKYFIKKKNNLKCLISFLNYLLNSAESSIILNLKLRIPNI